MANLIIPPVGTKGRFTLLPPFDGLPYPLEIYTLAASRQFTDVENHGEDLFYTYYNPFNLTEQDLARDRQAGALLITLQTAKYPPIYVPSSYVKAYPDQTSRPYNQTIVTLSLGALPEDIMLDPTLAALNNTVSDFLGVNPTAINVAFMPLTDVITPADHENREVSRLAAIKNRTTDYARLAAEQTKNQQLQQQIKILEKIVKDNNLLP